MASWVINKGGYQHIGIGKDVLIWKDGWLLAQNGHKVWTPVKGLLEEATTDMLINEDNSSWNQSLVHDILLPFEAYQICSIPLSCTNNKDKFI